MPDDEESEAVKSEERAEFEEAITVGTVYAPWKRHGKGAERVLKGQITLDEQE